MLVCDAYITWPKQFKPCKVPAVVGSIVVDGALTRCTFLYCVCRLKTAQMKDLCCLIQELVFELDHNTAEAIRNICYTKEKDAVKQWLEKFRLGYQELNGQTWSGTPKTGDSETLLQAIEEILWVTLEEYQVSSVSHTPVGFVTFTTSANASGIIELCLMLPKCCKIFNSPQYIYIYICVCVCVCVYVCVCVLFSKYKHSFCHPTILVTLEFS